MVQQTIYENAHVALDQTEYQKRYDNLTQRFETAKQRLEMVMAELDRMQTQRADIEAFVESFEALPDTLTEFKLENWHSLVDYATVTVFLQEVYKLSNAQEPPTSFPSRLGKAFASGWNGFVDVLEALVMILAYAWVPVLIILAVGGRCCGAGCGNGKRRIGRRKTGHPDRQEPESPSAVSEEPPDRAAPCLRGAGKTGKNGGQKRLDKFI